jgi:hypothetical protein
MRRLILCGATVMAAAGVAGAEPFADRVVANTGKGKITCK